MKFNIPLRLPSLSNLRRWWQVLRFKKQQKVAVYRYMMDAMRTQSIPDFPLTVTITRIGPRLLDDDNLAAACKYTRDQIAALVGVDDGSPLLTWVYAQVSGGPGKYSVDVEIVGGQHDR